MRRINVTTVQQYTIDRLRVSLNGSYETELLEKLSFKLFKEDGTEVTNRLKSIKNSNAEEWEYLLDSQTIDIYLKENTQLEEGKYSFVLIRDGEEIYQITFPLAHMEDVRVEFDKVEMIDMETIHVTLKSITGQYQSLEMMHLLKFSIIDEAGVQHNEAFQTLQEVIDASGETEITEFTLKLKPNRTLPKGYYDVRFTSQYKSRTFPIVEKFTIPFDFMTTQPAKIVSVQIAKQTVTQQTVLSMIFNPFLEKSLLLSATRQIIRERDGKDITAFFDATRISTTSYSSAGVSYITRLEIPLVDDTYSLEKGNYTVRWTWPGTNIPSVECGFEVGWVVNALDGISIYEGRFVDFDLPKAHFTDAFLNKYNLLIELNGKELDTKGIFGPLDEIAHLKGLDSPERSDHFGIDILDMSKIEDGNYTFLLWTNREADNNGFEGDIYYNYLGNLDIIEYLSPQIKEVYQSNVDTLTVVLKKAQPMSSLIQSELILYDQYGMIDFSDRLIDIENSNVWEPGQTMADRFDVVIKEEKTLSSGRYQFKIKFRGKESEMVFADIQHVEARRGFIEKIEQTALNKIKITFSEPQSRQFLLTTKFRVLKKYQEGAAYYESRFEHLENVLKADQMQFTEIEIMMDHEDSLPAGRYEISFIYENGEHNLSTIVYAYDVELGFMTNNIPEIKYITMTYNDEGEMLLEVNFKNDLEMELYNTAIFSLIREVDGIDIEPDFEDKEEWEIVTTVRRQDVKFVRIIRIPARDVEYAHIERGVYNFIFSWEGIIPYMENLEKQVVLEYYLPKLVLAEVVDMDMDRKWARIYFELPLALQYSYFEHLKAEVIGPDGEDYTEHFDTVFNSNNIDPSLPESEKLPSNSFNLDALRVDKLQLGKYQFVFYTDYTGTRQSDWIISLDIRQSLRPQILEAYQSAINKITVTLKEAIPRRLLEEMTIRFRNVNHIDYSDAFMTIDTANSDVEWAEDLREVTEFEVQLKGGRQIPQGTYYFALYNGNYLCDDYLFDIIWMEGASGEVDWVKPIALNEVKMHFADEESAELFKTLSLYVENEDGVDYSERFGSIDDVYNMIDTDFFDSINMHVTAPIPAGIYRFQFERLYHDVSLNQLFDNVDIYIPFLSNQFPSIYEVTVTKLGAVMDGDDALIIEFFPPLERTLYDSSAFGILKAYNTDIEVTERFKNIKTDGIIDLTYDQYDIEYVEFVTLEFANMTTLTRDRYKVRFEWNDDLHREYMRPLECEQDINYILFPLKSVEQIDFETVRLTFKEPTKAEDMKNSEVYVETRYSTVNADGPIHTTVDFSYQFLSMQKTNTFVDGELVPYVDVKMGTRDPEKPASEVLPANTYRFMIALDEDKEDDYTLRFVYAGSGYIEFMMNSERLYCDSSVLQASYDRLRYTWEKLQFTQMLDEFEFFIRRPKPNTEKDILDYSGLFMDTHEANYFYHLKNDDEYEEGYYEEAAEYDLVVDEIHYKLHQTLRAYATLKKGCALPAHTYNVGFKYKNKEYFENEITLPFMTSTPPDIRNMYIETNGDQSSLIVEFQPYAEFESLRASTFSIMTYKGDYKDGTPRGGDKTSSFGLVINGDTIELEKPDPEIRYVKAIKIPVNDNAILPSGWYRLKWTWPKYSFFPENIYIGGLKMLGIGLISARVIEKDKIEIVLEKEIIAKDFKSLTLNVTGYTDGDVTERFKELKDSNKDIKDDTKTTTYFLQLEDGEVIGGDTYRFTLSQLIESTDEDDEEEYIYTGNVESCVWEMTIVYMATSFPIIERIDNLSVEKYEVVEFTKANASSYIGRDVQLITSMDPNEILTLTEDDIPDYLDKYVKVFGKPQIDHLTVELDDEVIPSLIAALEMDVYNEDKKSFSKCFQKIRHTNPIEYRDVLYGIKIKLTKYDSCENIKKYDFYIQTADGKDISPYFNSIEKANNFVSDESRIKDFIITINEEYNVEEYQLKELVVRLEDASNKVIEKFKYTLQMQTIQTTGEFDLYLAPKTSIAPDEYSFDFRYTNDPNNENCVWLFPFVHTGNIPFLSNNLGTISKVTIVDRERIDLEFSELSLPVSAFLTFELRLVDEDGSTMDPDLFEDLMATNTFTDAETLEELEEPGIIHLRLQEGKMIPNGTYRFQFWMDIAAQEADGSDDSEEEGDDTDTEEEVQNIHTAEYCLWDKYAQLPIMFREMSNSVKSVEVMDINKLKITLEKAMDISIIKNFVVDLYNPLKDVTYENKFDSVEKSNFFGMYIMTTDKSNIMYSEDGEYWYTFDTGYEYSYTKCFYHESSKTYFALTTVGKIISFKEFKESSYWGVESVNLVEYAEKEVKYGLNDYVIIDNKTLVIVGNTGTILVGTIDPETGDIKLVNKNPEKKITKNTLNAINYTNGVLLVVGQKGTILRSNDKGNTWSTIVTGITHNLNDIVYHKNTIKVEGDLPTLTEEEETADDGKTPDPVVTTTVDTSAYFVCGNNGTILTCSKFEDGFKTLPNKNHKALFSIISHGDRIIAVGDAGVIVNIDDTIDGYELSVTNNPDCKFALREIAYCGNKYFICGANSSWLTSREGESWTINNNFADNAMKSVTFIPSQYSSDKADWFYLNVKNGEEIAPINYYSGWEVPTLESDFCAKWQEDNELDEHLQDFYTKFEFEDHRPKPKEFYHFVKKAKILEIDEEDPDEEENPRIELDDVSYVWEKCPGYESAHNGLYYVRLRESKNAEVDDWIYSTPSAINLPYMTSTDLKITNVELHSPDDKPNVEFYKPYLQIDFSGATENCFHYVRYDFIRSEDNTNCTNWFLPIRMGEILYSSALKVTGLIIYGDPKMSLSSVKRGKYKLNWTWMAPGTAPDKEKYVIYSDIPVKNMVPLIESITTNVNDPKIVMIRFTKYIHTGFFMKTNRFEMNIRRVPNTRKEYEKYNEYDYSNVFRRVEDSTEFTDLDYKIETDEKGFQYLVTKEIRLELQDGKILAPGNYLIKMTNTSDYYEEKETEDTIWVSCTDDRGLELIDELTTNLPKLRSVTLERYIAKPVRDDGQSARKFTHKGMVYASIYLNNWKVEGTIEDHLADSYVDTSTDTTYYLVKSGSTYEWWTPSEDVYLCIAFDGSNLPMYDTFIRRYKEWILAEMEDIKEEGTDNNETDDTGPQKLIEDLRPWFRQDLSYFQYSFIFISDENGDNHKYISKLYIPFNPEASDFPGCSNGTFTLRFDPAGIYRDLELRHIVLPRCMKSYGTIGGITPKNPSLRLDDPTAGFIIKFEKELGKKFVQAMSLDITRILTDEEKKILGEEENEIDVSEKFQTLAASNKEVFDDTTIDSVSQVYLWLDEEQYLDHGTYRITLTGEAEQNIVFPIDEDKKEVPMSKIVTSPWLSVNIPNDIEAKVTIGKYATNPVLTITFVEISPAKSSLVKSMTSGDNGRVTVKRHKNSVDYSNVFRGVGNSTVKFNIDKDQTALTKGKTVEEWIKSIEIPMKNNCALPKGTYDVTFKYQSEALLENIPYVVIDPEAEEPVFREYAQFVTTQVLISKLGSIDTVKCLNSRKCKITIKKNAAISTNAKLAASQVGQVLNVKTWKALLGKLNLQMLKESNKKIYSGRFGKGQSNVKITNNGATYRIKPNFLINPLIYRFMYIRKECTPIAPRYREFEGLIWNKIGKAANDPRVWIINEIEPAGKENCRVYKTFKAMKARRNQLKRMNLLVKYKYKLCKKCRKIKLLSTNKVSGCINTYDIPYQYKEGVAKFFTQLVKKWYKMRSKKVKITLAAGKKLNKKGDIVNDTKNPTKKYSYHCSTAPFKGFAFEKRTEGKGEERQVSFGCANYVAKDTKWEFECLIATVKKGQIPKNRSKIYFAMLNYQPAGSDKVFHLKRGYKCTKKGKKTSVYNKYIKTLEKMIAKKKKNSQRCTRCKKKELAEKKNKKIGWGAARFPVQVMTKKTMKKLPSLLNVAESKGGFKSKKKNKKGCKKPKFVWTKVTIKKKAYAKLKCKNGKSFPKTLEVGAGYQGIYYASTSSKK